MIVRLILLFVTFVAVAKASLDWELSDEYYCGRYLSCNGTPNTMCHKKTVFGSDCRDPIYIPIDENLKNIFLNTHNELRNQQAVGENENILKPPIADMATMQWDDELELMSLTNAMQCKMVKDECRRTAKYKQVGQNLYELCSSANYLPINIAIDFAVKSWYEENQQITNLSEEHNVDEDTLAKSGQFLQVVKSNADRIGCSIVQYLDVKNYRCTSISCNYNAESIVGVPTYEIGPTASRCSTGTNSNYTSLCSEDENYLKHEYADTYFTNTSPIVAEWLKKNKRLDTGGKIKYVKA